MAGYKAEIVVSATDVEILVNLLAETLDPPPAISMSETPVGWRVELYFTDAPDRALLDAVTVSVPAASIIRNLKFEALPDEDWVASAQRDLHPIEAGRFFIHGSHDRARAESRPFAIEIDAGQAFGTAHHGTTRGCLILLDGFAKKGLRPRVLDLGTGSGILAIAAGKSLRSDVLATDIDPIAVQVAKSNFAKNGLPRRVTVARVAGLQHPVIAKAAPFGLVMANILAGPLISLAPQISRLVASGGTLILSGLLDDHVRQVMARYLAQGFVLYTKLSLDGWTTLQMRSCRRIRKSRPAR